MRSRFLLAWLVVGAALTTSRLAAQDVTVTDPVWMNRENPPAGQPPQFKKRPKPEYPDEMKKTDQVGYVIVPKYSDAKGDVAAFPYRGTNPYFEKALVRMAPEFRPALNEGKPVEGVFWYAVIFNPASANAKTADSSPRLESLLPVIVDKTLLPEGTHFPLVVWGVVNLDEKGGLQNVSLDDAANEVFLEGIGKSVRDWRFSPARKAGQPEAGQLRVPFFLTPQLKAPTKAATLSILPKLIHRAELVYPQAMKTSRQRGEVLVGFILDENGIVTNPVVLKSNNPGFDDAAIESVMKYKFEPGKKDGKPVRARMQQLLVFEFTGFEGNDAVTVEATSKKEQEKLPPEYRYDVAPQPTGILIPVYPYALARDKITGKATVAFLIDAEGKVSQVQVIEASNPEFGLAMVAAVEAFRFRPALKDGKPTATVLKMEHKFENGGAMTLSSAVDSGLLELEHKHPEKISPANALDAPLKPISQRAAVFPSSMQNRLDRGEARVEILVDKEGKVRLPRIVSATDPAFGYAAVQAIADWRFEPPKAGGKPVVVRVQAPFSFELGGIAEKPQATPDEKQTSAANTSAEEKQP